MATIILYEEGLLDINAPVINYIPEFIGENKEKILVHQLMTHTTRMNDEVIWPFIDSAKDTVEIPLCEETQDSEINERLYLGYKAPLKYVPGEEMSYCNYGIQLLGEIIRRVIKQSLDSFTKERIFKPLGMKSTFFVVPDSVVSRIVKRPQDAVGGDWFLNPDCLKSQSASGGAYSNITDMAVFLQMFLNKGSYGGKRILNPETIHEMTKNQIPGISAKWGEAFFPEASWGYCWDILAGKHTWGDLLSPSAFAHGGYGGVVI